MSESGFGNRGDLPAPLLTVKQAARRLQVSTATVYALISSGRLLCYRVGEGRGVIRISEDHMSVYLAGSTVGKKRMAKGSKVSGALKHIKL